MNRRVNDPATVLREEAAHARTGPISPVWRNHVERLSTLVQRGVSATHIAFLGTSMLARAAIPNVDLFAIKPTHARDNPHAYSARSLCHSVLVPLAAELGIHLGVTGREPLNNQPYFRMTSLDDGTPVRERARPAYEFTVQRVREIQSMTQAQARKALRAFVAVRREYMPSYAVDSGEVTITPERLALCIDALVLADSEHGRRAQAVTAGLLDVFVGTGRVESGRINDPSRHYPGDVCIRNADDSGWEKAVEVRDKPVSPSDIFTFGVKCLDMGVRDATVVMISHRQVRLNEQELFEWAAARGLGLTLFYGWQNLTDQILYWAAAPKLEAALSAVERIEARLIAVEAAANAVEMWRRLVRTA